MQITMSSASLPVCELYLNNLIHILEKGAAHAAARKFDPQILVNYRLAPDMFPFSRQVQIACDNVKNGLARLAGVEPPKLADTEASLDELKERVQKTLAFIQTLSKQAIDGTEDKDIVFPAGPTVTRTMKGQDYLLNWLLPNVLFHITTAYVILRHNGVEVGKLDYLLGAHR